MLLSLLAPAFAVDGIDAEFHATASVEWAVQAADDRVEWRSAGLGVTELLLIHLGSLENTNTRWVVVGDLAGAFDPGDSVVQMLDLYFEQDLGELTLRAGMWRPELGVVQTPRPYLQGLNRGVGYWMLNPARQSDQVQVSLFTRRGDWKGQVSAMRVWDADSATSSEAVDVWGRVDRYLLDDRLDLFLVGLYDFAPKDRDLIWVDTDALRRGDPGTESRTAVIGGANWSQGPVAVEGQVTWSIGGATMDRDGVVTAVEPGRAVSVYTGVSYSTDKLTVGSYLEWNGPAFIAIPRVSYHVSEMFSLSALYGLRVDEPASDAASVAAMLRF